jgi:DNA-directed RNA polymerase III subunit RPC4
LEEAEAKGQAPTAAVLKQPSSKGKGKAKASDTATSKKEFKGVWGDSDDTVSPVKTEENSEDENMVNAEQVGIVEQPDQGADQQEPPPDAESRTRGHTRGIAEPVLQTDEDRAEWARFQSSLTHIRAELGPDESAEVDAAGDVNMADAANGARKPTVRDNNVYLFQIPPLMPELLSASIKKEPVEEQAPLPPPAPTPTANGKKDVKVKLEEGAFTDTSKTHEAPRFASGHVGKLRVRQSGRTTLDWGGTSYELTPGQKASFLQEVVSMHVVPEAQRVVPEDAGEATSFGRVKGKFVVVPDWGEMLG